MAAGAAPPTTTTNNMTTTTILHPGSVYLRDDLLTNDYNGRGARRSTDDISSIITSIIPRAHKSLKEHRLGVSVCYDDDRDLNKFFVTNIKNKLQEQHLLPRLSYETESRRDIYILNPTYAIYNREVNTLIAELEYRNDIDIMKLDKFESNVTRKKYIKITLDSIKARDDLNSLGKVIMFQREFPAKAKIGSPTQTTSPTNGSTIAGGSSSSSSSTLR